MEENFSFVFGETEKYATKYGMRFTRALKAVKEGKVKKYMITDAEIERWIVVGTTKDYIIVDDNYCSCYDFYHSVLQLHETDKCYHLLAKKIAETTQQYDTFEITFQKFLKFLREWLY